MWIQRVLESGEMVEEFVRRVYYPGTPEEKAAKAIVVRAGEQVQGIEFSIASSMVHSRRLRGTVLDGETGKPAGGAIVRLTPRQLVGAGLIVPAATVGNDGTFEVKGLNSEAYSMLVTFGRGGNAYMVIDAGYADVDGIKVVATQGVDVPWSASFEGGDAAGSL